MMKKMKKFWSLFFCLMLLLTSCKPQQDERLEESSVQEQPLVVFYEGRALPILTSFQALNPDVELRIYQVYGGEGELEKMIQQRGVPDLILTENLFEWDENCEKGYVADIMEFYQEEEGLNTNDYLPGTFEVMEQEGQLLGLPLSVMMYGLAISEEDWETSALSTLPEDYTGEDLYRAFLAELTQTHKEGWLFSEYTLLHPVTALKWLGGITENEDGSRHIDQDLFNVLYDFQLAWTQNNTEAKAYYEELYSAGEVPDYSDFDKFHNNSALDPRRYEGNIFIHPFMGAPQNWVPYVNSVYYEIEKTDMKYLWYTDLYEANRHPAMMRMCGYVFGESTHKQEAYDLLRALMDTPLQIMIQPGGNTEGEILCPVNREVASELLADCGSQKDLIWITEFFKNNLFQVNMQPLSEEEINMVEQVIDNVDTIHWEKNSEEFDALYETYYKYINEGSTDAVGCYQEIMEILNPDSEG